MPGSKTYTSNKVNELLESEFLTSINGLEKSRIKNISKIYNDEPPTYALDDVSLDLPEKGMVFIVGKSGSGKSTLLNILAGFDKPTKGTIKVFDQDLNTLTHQIPFSLDI